MAGEIVHDHDVAGLQRRREKLLDIGFEGRGVDRAVENQRGDDPLEPKAGDEGGRFPVAMGNGGAQSFAARGATVPRR